MPQVQPLSLPFVSTARTEQLGTLSNKGSCGFTRLSTLFEWAFRAYHSWFCLLCSLVLSKWGLAATQCRFRKSTFHLRNVSTHTCSLCTVSCPSGCNFKLTIRLLDIRHAQAMRCCVTFPHARGNQECMVTARRKVSTCSWRSEIWFRCVSTSLELSLIHI